MRTLKDLKILVVEDDPQARDFMMQFLTEENCNFKVAKDGEDALQQFDPFQPDLVLLDIMLPKMDGLEVLRELKKKDLNVKIIMTTAISNPSAIQACIEAGASTYVVKPLNLESLESVIEKL